MHVEQSLWLLWCNLFMIDERDFVFTLKPTTLNSTMVSSLSFQSLLFLMVTERFYVIYSSRNHSIITLNLEVSFDCRLTLSSIHYLFSIRQNKPKKRTLISFVSVCLCCSLLLRVEFNWIYTIIIHLIHSLINTQFNLNF